MKTDESKFHFILKDYSLYYEKFQDGTVKSVQDEIPFEVPEGWEWVRLENISSMIHYGYTASAKTFGNCKLIRITDIQNNQVDWENVPFCDIDTTKNNNYIIENGDILIARTGGTIGKSYVVNNLKTNAVFASYLIRVKLLDLNISSTVKLFLNSHYYWKQLDKLSMGSGQPNVNASNLKKLIIPIPSKNYQTNISAVLKKIMVFVESINNEQNEIINLKEKIKIKTLSLAMQGKLIPQDPNDEPASVFLEKIKEEKEKLIKEGKIKRNKKESTIIRRGESYYELLDGKEKDITNEIPFEIPEKWMWIRLRDIAKEIKAGGDRPTEVSKIKNEIYQYPIYSNGSKNKGLYGYSKRAIIKESAITISARGTIGYSEIRQPNFTPIVRLICILLNTKFIDIKYINYVFNLLISPQEGTSIPQLTVPNIREKLIPLPPNKEQMKISIILDKLKEV